MIGPSFRLERYVPNLVRATLAVDAHALDAPRFVRVEGALLFADITGFTGLAERLATRGPDGAERLTEVLDACFHELVAIVVAHGGDVLKFAGDALLALWTVPGGDDGGGLAEAVSRAATCALSFQAALHERAVGGEDRLSLRVNVAAGPLCLSGVGGLAGRRELALWGDTLTQLQEARRHTLPGEVVLSHAARAWLGDDARVEPSHGTGWRLVALSRPLPPSPLVHASVDDQLAASLLPFVPASVLNRLHERQLKWLGELRAVTVLFVRAPPTAGSDEAVAARLQELASVVQAAVLRFDGTLNKASVDEKGIMLFAAWGLPPHVHEDDPTRAARAALAVRQALAERGLGGAIGMASGLIYAGVIGSDARAEYTGIGDAVNLAARLTEAAEDDITTDGETARLAGRELVFTAHGTFAAKGKARPIPIFRPTGAEPARGRPGAEIVGREPQRKAIRELVSGLSAGRGGEVIVLEGMAGLGKSRLVAEAVEAAQAEGCAVWVAEPDSVETSTAYFAWRSVFAQALGLRGTASPEACRQRVTTWLERRPELAERQTLLNVVLPVALPERALTAQMTGEVRAENTNAALVTMLGDLAGGRPVLLVVEDGHWLDDESRLFLRRVLRDVPGLSLLFATRPVDPPPPEYRLLVESAGPRAFRLEAMSEPESAMLVARRLGVPAIPDAASALIFARAEGNPFFTEEMAFALRDAGVLRIVDGACRLQATPAEIAALRLPDTVHGFVTSRVDRLDPRQQLSLKVASVVGHVFALSILRGIHPVAPEASELVAELDPLVERELLRAISLPASPPSDREYGFKHNITHEAVYSLMLFAQRRELHRHAAEWIEARFAADLGPHLPLLAHHWSRAEDGPKAVEFLTRAGLQALDRFANKAAVGFLTQARAEAERHRVVIDPAKRAEWSRGLAHAWYGDGQLAACAEEAATGLSLLGWPVPSSTLGRALALGRELAIRAFQAFFPSAARVEPALAEPRLRAVRLQTRLSEFFLFRQDVLGLLYSGVRELNLAEPAGPSGELGRAYGTMSAILGTVPLVGLAEACVRQAEHSARHCEPIDRAFILTRCAVYGIYGAQWGRCRQWLEEATETSRRLSDDKTLQDAMTILLLLDHYEGRFDAALPKYDAFLEFATRQELDQGLHWSLLGKGMNLVRLGRTAEAAPLLARASAWADQAASPPEQIWAHGMKALCHLGNGELDAARVEADATLQRVEAAPPTAYWTQQSTAALCETYQALARRAASETERSEMRERFRRAVQGMQRFARVFPFGGAHAAYWQGAFAEDGGRTGTARRRYGEARGIARHFNQPYEEGLAEAALLRLA